MNRVPGSITNRGVGMRRRKHLGWRKFDLKEPGIQTSDPHSMVASEATTNGNSVVTLATTVTESTHHGILFKVYGVPLTNNYGDPITFTTPFCLKTQVEFISITGDYFGNSEPIPCFGLGIGQKDSDFNLTDNHWIMTGLLVNSTADPPAMRMYNTRSSGDVGFTYNQTSSTNPANALMHTTFYVGPAVGSNRDAESVSTIMNATKFSGDSYAYTSGAQGAKYDHHNDASTFDSDGQVYLYAFFGTKNAAYDFSSSGTPPVITCRLRYLVTSDPGGWGGSGT
tara:strand:+ start:4096 stop:4941 length:846 start_codon:yes stop_codon:yes gene_type:complete